jgi:hypothetical protein
MVHLHITRNRAKEPVYQVYRGGGAVYAETKDLSEALAEARGCALEAQDATIRVHPGHLDGLEIAGESNVPLDYSPDDLPGEWVPAAGTLPFPPAPAFAVGADAEHTGPSAMGPGTDEPGFGGEVDREDAEGVIGGVMDDAVPETTPTEGIAPEPAVESTPLRPKRKKGETA